MEAIKVISEYGILVVIAGLFIWEKFQYSKIIGNLLSEIKITIAHQAGMLTSLEAALLSIRASCDNTATALTIISHSLLDMKGLLERHDKRSEYINKDVRDSTIMLRMRPCMHTNELYGLPEEERDTHDDANKN